jgi:ribosomal protein S18 acetylase RimI-like enzyme
MINGSSSDPARFLDWDSTFFEKRIAWVNSNILSPDRIESINTWSQQNSIDCLYFLAASDDDQTVTCAENDDYHLVDLRITLAVKLSEQNKSNPPESSIRFAAEKDIDDLRSIAGINHTNSRFFTDHHFDREKCRQLYEIWIEKCVRAENGRVFVWDHQGKAVAYVTAELNSDQTGSIELVGVAPEFQSKGIGKKLVSSALLFFYNNLAVSANTVTQGRNIHALKLYQKSGFAIQSIELWYHKWFENSH